MFRQWLAHYRILYTWLGIALWSLADNESSFTFGRPANRYDTRPQRERPVDRDGKRKSYISAWGLFQYNKGAWQGLARRKSYLGNVAAGPDYLGDQMPEDASVRDEIWIPIRRYWILYNHLRSQGYRDPHGLAMSIRVLHSGSGRLREWLTFWRPGHSAYRAYQAWMASDAEYSDWARDHRGIWSQFNTAIRQIWQT